MLNNNSKGYRQLTTHHTVGRQFQQSHTLNANIRCTSCTSFGHLSFASSAPQSRQCCRNL